jgi:uncharacterized protein YbjQ (UPF0145 family)
LTDTADHAFTSDLTVGEHHAVRSVGFSPVGQVMGGCVYYLGYPTPQECGYAGGRKRDRAAVAEAVDLSGALFEAHMLATRRMSQECVGLGGDGVVAVRLTVTPFSAGGLEFQAIGTAVRANGPVRARRPFLSALSGQDFAKLVMEGWVPCGMVIGVAVAIRHDDYRTERQARSWQNTEIDGHTKLVSTARRWARDRLHKQCARLGGSDVVVHTTSLKISEQRCRDPNRRDPGHDHLAEATVVGTAITPFSSEIDDAPPAPLPIMRLR